jgi:hypothetical protein
VRLTHDFLKLVGGSGLRHSRRGPDVEDYNETSVGIVPVAHARLGLRPGSQE